MNGSQQAVAELSHATPAELAVYVRGLHKSYRDVEAVRGIDLEVRHGEIFALLGPNGAGKTTTVEVLEGYRSRNAGEVSVLGADPAHPTREWRARLGIVLQACQVEPELTVEESLTMFAGYFPRPLPVEKTLGLVGLTKERKRRAGKLSGGLQRRLDVALGLIGNPELLFLDEPTTGFDPAARKQFWAVIRDLRALGKTIVMTTHYMDEAQALADRVAIIADGRIVVQGAPAALGGRELARTRISFRLPDAARAAELPRLVGLSTSDGIVRVESDEPTRTLKQLVYWSDEHGIDLLDVEVTRPSLEEVYLKLTEANG